jgi:hypothetical protein
MTQHGQGVRVRNECLRASRAARHLARRAAAYGSLVKTGYALQSELVCTAHMRRLECGGVQDAQRLRSSTCLHEVLEDEAVQVIGRQSHGVEMICRTRTPGMSVNTSTKAPTAACRAHHTHE